MCGIAGFYGFRDDSLIKEISKEIEHRGPDGEGFFLSDTSTLLNRRLAIIDVEGGDQPIYNEDKTVVVVYNGEIFNYRELTIELKKAGHVFKTQSDTEIIVHGYEQWGDKCFDKLNGMFAIALYDTKKKKLLLVRDHFGIKPVYFAESGDRFVFGSEIRAILKSNVVKKEPNDRIIYRYLKYRIHDDQRETFFKNISRLLPGEMLEISKKGTVIKKYTNLMNDLLELKEEKIDQDKFREELFKAIRYRLISEVPVGTCLSGGLDSSTVVAVVNKLLKENASEADSVGRIQNTFSAVFPGSINDEEKYIDELMSRVNAQSHKVKPDPVKFFDEIEDFISTQEEPTISTGPYAQYKVMEMAHKHVTVVLDGQGADEMMAGYLPYYFVYLRQLFDEKKYPKLISEAISSLDVIKRFFLSKLERSIPVSTLLGGEFAEKYSDEKFTVEARNLKKRLIEDIFSNSLQSLLRYEDKNAMRFSIEGRVPFLDFNLLKTVFSMSDEAIIKNGWNKYILRASTYDILPPLINQRRNKIGFTTPENEWFLKMKNRIYTIFASDSFAKRKYFNQGKVLKTFQKFIEGKTTDSMVFWRLLNLEIWLRLYFDKKPAPKSEVQYELGKPNKSKKIKIDIETKTYERYPVKTELFKKGDRYASKIAAEISKSIGKVNPKAKKWLAVVSEKIVAISQGRSYFIWDIRPSYIADFLSKFVKRTPYGIGLGSPWTMQLAINEAGLSRILLATAISALTKPLGISGMFYRVAGETVRSIDGPTEYSLYPSNVSAKLGPSNPHDAVRKISESIKGKTNSSSFIGSVIIDANDIGRDVLGNDTGLANELIEKIMRDNPMGQGSEQTPLILVTYS
jgi:asparagine synthase (glutamine-hydrolysing)